MSEQLHLCRKKLASLKMEIKWMQHWYGDRKSSGREIRNCSFYSGQTIMQKVRGSRSQAKTYPEKEDYALRDSLLIMQQ